MKKLLLLIFIFSNLFIFSQNLPENNFKNYFDFAYIKHPEIPKGILEAVSFSYTRFQHITHTDTTSESCTGIPNTYGIMGLTLNGKNYFKNNLILVSNLSGYSIQEIIQSPEKNILAYALAFVKIKTDLKINDTNPESHLPVLAQLTELPDGNLIQNFALNSQLYVIYDFLNSTEYQNKYQLPNYKIDFIKLFGKDNYEILHSSEIIINDKKINNTRGSSYQNHSVLSPDYPAALWNPAATCNFSSRNGTAITAVTIHTVQGSYAGCISWFQNCAANASAHYVVRSNDGQVTQMVLEVDKAWHVKTENPYTIGIEHEGYINNPAWYTNNMYQSSADIVRDITQSGYGINPLRTYFGPGCSGSTPECYQGACTKIKGHQMFPAQNHTDPGPNWNWAYYYLLINNNNPFTTLTNSSGTFYDSGGANANYTNDERTLTLIQTAANANILLNFNSFNIENNYDYLFIYDGATTSAPLIGQFTGTNNPGTIISSGNELLVEFRSDCATSSTGWEANWQTIQISTNNNELYSNNSIQIFPNPFSENISVNYFLNSESKVEISLIDVLGKKQLLLSEKQSSGQHQLQINANENNMSKGIYFIQITINNQHFTSKIILK